ncbi:MAG: PilZ domain-containing protein [Myxococcales bacterium]|nr:PilZ domain-containing protein [Myxococcales bacterium]
MDIIDTMDPRRTRNQSLRLRRGARARTDFPVTVREGSLKARSRCIELSASGAIILRTRGDGAGPSLLTLELYLPERHGAIHVLARRIWSFGSQAAFRFERVSDADRLSLAEHVDLATLRGALVA